MAALDGGEGAASKEAGEQQGALPLFFGLGGGMQGACTEQMEQKVEMGSYFTSLVPGDSHMPGGSTLMSDSVS